MLIALIFAGHVAAQLRSGGEVVEMVDGKTVIVAIPSGRMTIELQHIEVPEPGQQLYESVKEHLKKFLVGNVVEFQPRTVMRGKTIGRLLLNGVDVSQQMLRDGAAWHSPDSQNGQSQEERNLYKDAETKAKQERRGVWGVQGLLTAWEYRAEREKIAAQKEMAEWEIYKQRSRSGVNASQSRGFTNIGPWSDFNVGGASHERFGLHTGYEPALMFGHIRTSGTFLNLTGGNVKQSLEYRVYYVYQDSQFGQRRSAYLIGFLATANNYRFSKANNLIVTADGQKLALGKAKRFAAAAHSGAQELMWYRASRSALNKIANASSLSITLGGFSGPMNSDSQDLMRQLLASTN